MTAVHIYLVCYFCLIAGALLALWQARVLSQIPLLQTVGVVLVAVGLGVVLALLTPRKSQ